MDLDSPCVFCRSAGVKLALVALKCDLREDESTREQLGRYGEKCISYEEGLEVAKRIRAVRYLGTSLSPLWPFSPYTQPI